MQKFVLFLLIALAPHFVQSQNLGFVIQNGKTKVQIPIEIINNLVVIPVVLNDKIPLKFVLDTGVRSTILTQKTYSDILGLVYSKNIVVSGAGGVKLVEAFVTNNVTLDLPGVHGAGHAMLVLGQDYLELRNYLGTDVHGVLGYELFSRFIVNINYEKKQLTLMLPERFKKKKSFQELPITIQDTKPYAFVNIEMNDTTTVPTKLLIDTGASHSLMINPESDKRLAVPDENVKSILGRGIGGVITGRIARIKSLDMGKYIIPSVIANFPDPNSYMDTLMNKYSVARNGSIGGEILSRFNIIFDFPEGKIYIKKNPSLKKEFNYNMSGLTLKAKGSRLRNYEITNVQPGSPAERSGLKIGDQVIFINGIPSYNLDLNTINGFFNSKVGKRVSMEIERDGKRSKTEFRLESPI